MLHCRLITTVRVATGLVLASALGTSANAQTLTGKYWNAPSGTTTTIAGAQSFMLSNSAQGAFTAQQSTLEGAGYNGGDGSTAKDFLGADGSSFSGVDGGMSDGLFDMKGYLTVGSDQTYNFSTTSDDGSAMFIDGIEVVNNDGLHGSQSAFGSQFLNSGRHTLDVVYYNWNAGGGGSANLTADFGGGIVAPVPEASTFGLFGMAGLAVLAMMMRARRRGMNVV